ncbi:MAG: hypothetical protein ACYC3L_01065 [Gemmatimonadaceae bacterium]
MKLPTLPNLPLWAVRLGILIALASAALWTKACYDGELVRRAALQHTVDSLRVSERGQRQRADSLAAAYRVDTLRLTRDVVRWRTLRDTLTLSDTVRLTVRESVLVAAADTAIQQCTRTLDTCDALVAVRDSQIGNLRAQLATERKQRPGFFKRTAKGFQWLGAGVVLGLVLR